MILCQPWVFLVGKMQEYTNVIAEIKKKDVLSSVFPVSSSQFVRNVYSEREHSVDWTQSSAGRQLGPSFTDWLTSSPVLPRPASLSWISDMRSDVLILLGTATSSSPSIISYLLLIACCLTTLATRLLTLLLAVLFRYEVMVEFLAITSSPSSSSQGCYQIGVVSAADGGVEVKQTEILMIIRWLSSQGLQLWWDILQQRVRQQEAVWLPRKRNAELGRRWRRLQELR